MLRACAVPALAPRVLAGDGLATARVEVVLPVPRAGCPVEAAVARGLAVAVFTAADAAATFLGVALDALVATVALAGVFEDRAVLPTVDVAAAPDDTAGARAVRLADTGLPASAEMRGGDFFVCFA
ncbi:hypothetical protein OZ13_20460 [Xanthomonas cannabis pv. cannabis]|nr:hypothetical protein OZ13_20460 [Xanthomonas cannabis pv. cannabis]